MGIVWLAFACLIISGGVVSATVPGGACSSPQIKLLSSYSTTDSAILTAHATSVHLSVVCESTPEAKESQRFYGGPVFFKLDDELELRPLAVIEPGRLQASWKTSSIVAPAAMFTLRFYGEQAAAQLRKGASASELGHLTISRPAATRDAWLAGEAVALVSAFVLAILAITSKTGIDA